ncbi:complement component C8 gamma chain [Echeneis naucrates]|uniref:complement component C8 gamma chain n=1 Tax=Echeneis naucrates TaxID=173247 RepID=UPI00111433F7|nr:complement component C8 gamma chain [Echeneis naucrates]
MAGVWPCMLAVMVLCVCLWGYADAVGGAKSRPRPQRRPKKTKVEPTVATPPARNIDLPQMTGTWYLVNAASKCSHLMKKATSVEPTVMNIAISPDGVLLVSTKTRFNHQCWEVRQIYYLDPTPGYLTIRGVRPDLNTGVAIGDTDYTTYLIMYYQQRGTITMKLYSRSQDVTEPILTKFEDLAEKQGLGLAYIFPFPTYSHCGDVDQENIINCVPTC